MSRAFEIDHESEMEAFAVAIAAALPTSAVIALDGPLGAGKTRFVQALAHAAGVDRIDVTSPTFVLVQEYRGRVRIAHFDAYRLRDRDEFLELGPEEYFAAPGWSVIEWAEKVEDCLPPDRLDIRLEVTGPTSRRATLVGRGEPFASIVDRLAPVLPRATAGASH
jgi:tRNA threonylcarbamoyladenosine biosynthesis protein TsaE